MKQCTRCGNIVQNNSEQFCPKCGGTNFKPVAGNQQVVRPQMAKPQTQQNNTQPNKNQNINKPQLGKPGQTQNQQRANMYNQQGNGQIQNRPQNQQMNRNMNQHNNTPANNSTNTADIDISTIKLSKKQQQSKDLAVMNAMKQAQMNGESIDIVAFERNWILTHVVKNNNGNNNVALNESTISMTRWLIALLISTIPIVGILYSVFIIRDYSYSETQRNFHKAFIIFYSAMFIISIIATILINSI